MRNTYIFFGVTLVAQWCQVNVIDDDPGMHGNKPPELLQKFRWRASLIAYLKLNTIILLYCVQFIASCFTLSLVPAGLVYMLAIFFFFFFASVGATCVSHPCVIVISAHAWRTMCILRERTKSSLQRFECWRWGQRWSNRYALGTCFYTQQCGSDCSYAQAVKLWVYKLKVLV